jgi:hypothetical protein
LARCRKEGEGNVIGLRDGKGKNKRRKIALEIWDGRGMGRKRKGGRKKMKRGWKGDGKRMERG